MPFGLCNAPTTFMRLMNDVLLPFIDSFAIIYLDDIMVYNYTLKEHISHLTQVLETLKKHQLLENIKKCEFSQQTLVYLGYVIGEGELKIDPTKMEAILKLSIPTNVYVVRSFIRETQYLRKFIVFYFYYYQFFFQEFLVGRGSIEGL